LLGVRAKPLQFGSIVASNRGPRGAYAAAAAGLGRTSPRVSPLEAACVRDVAASLLKMAATCVFTVAGSMWSSRAITLFL
jgi:hypothetical protein